MIEFFVPGIPRPGGSKRAFVNKYTGKASLVDASGEKGKDWRGDVKVFAKQEYKGPPLDVPLVLHVIFFMPRPKCHYGSGKNSAQIKQGSPLWPTSKPDCTKLLRSLEDACTGILWGDDAQIVEQHVSKEYASVVTGPGAHVQVMAKHSNAISENRRRNRQDRL